MFRKLLLATAALLSTTGVARADWHQATSKHFVVYMDGRADDVKAMATRLEQFDQGIRAWHKAPEDRRGPSARVTVFVLDDVSAIQKLAGRASVAGFYSPRAGQSVAFTPESSAGGGLNSTAILFHEYAHHWMLTNWSDAALPPWFVEGFAELHATAMFRGDTLIFGAPPEYRKYTVADMNLLPTERLLRFDPGRLSREQRDALYSRGWLLSHYLTFDAERRKQLADYIGALNSGKAGEASALIGGGNLDLKLNAYLRRSRFSSAAFPLDSLRIGTIGVRKLGAGEAAIMPAFIASNRGVDAERAPAVAATARAVAASHPGDAFVQDALAEAEFDTCSVVKEVEAACFSRAIAAADRARAADPKSVHALVYRGMAEVEMLKADKVTDAARWTEARRWFLAANKVDTEAPQPLIQYYDSFEAADAAPTANADAALLYAYALAPYDGALRIKATQVYLRQDKPAEARVALSPVAYNIEAPAQAERMQKVLAVLDRDGSKAALAVLTAEAKKTDEDETE